MKKQITKYITFFKSRPNETKCSLAGLVVGLIAGLLIGGVGIAAMGGAFGIPASIILGGVGALIGNRYGVERDNNKD